MDYINNRELREQILIQKPNTMEEALMLATHIEALDILETPKSDVRESHCGKCKVQNLEPDSGTGAMKEVERPLADIKEALLDIRQSVQMLINQASNCQAMPKSARSAIRKPVNSIVNVSANTCKYCKELGHWMYNCLQLKQRRCKSGIA